MKVAQQPQKPPNGSKSDLSYNLRVKRYSNLQGHCIRLYVAAATAATLPAGLNILICRYKIKGCYVQRFKL